MRGGLSFRDPNTTNWTFLLTGGTTAADEGKAVTLTASSTAGLGSNAGKLLGKLLKVDHDGTGTVAISGIVQLKYSAAPTAGDAVVIDGTGKVRAATGTEPGRGIVLEVDTTNTQVSVLL